MGKKTAFVTKRPAPEGVRLEPLKPKAPAGNAQPPSKEDTSSQTSRTQSSHSSRNDLSELEQESEGEILAKKTHNLETLKNLITEYESVAAFRVGFTEKNLSPDYEEFDKLRNSRKLDANLKKCTNFVKKLKSITAGQFEQIEKEFEGLNLSKYISEIATALTESRFKISDIQQAVKLFSMFHQRYREFRPQALELYRKILMPRKADFNPAAVSKLPIDLRLFGELVMCGLFEKEDGFNLIMSSVRNIISNDKDGMQYVSLIIAFCRGLGYEMAGLIPTNVRELSDKYKMTLPENDYIPTQKKEQLKQILIGYYNSCAEQLNKSHEDVLESEVSNRKFLKTKGEVPEDRQTMHSELVMAFDINISIVKKFAGHVDKELPTLRELPADPDADQADEILRVLNAEHGAAELPEGFQAFEDEETRDFYQNIPDMKVYLPQIAYRDNVLKAAEQTAEMERREKELANVEEDLTKILSDEKAEEEEEEADTEDVLPSAELAEDEKTEAIKPNFKAFLDGLMNCFNAKLVDTAAREFVDNFNNKPSRKKLVNYLFRLPWQRVDLTPNWARLVAVLAPVMPEIQFDLCQMLYKDFRYLVRKRNQLFIETKLKIVRYIGELVKFGVFPKADAFQCFKILLLNFTHHQIDMACAFMETCGRYLHRNKDSHRRMQIYLEEFLRRKNLKSLDARHVSMVDNAYLMVCPKEGATRGKPSEMLAFIKYVIYDTLQRSNIEECIKLMRSLDWEDGQVVKYFIDVMSQPWKFRAQQYSQGASLLAAIKPHRSHVAIRVVDNVIDGIWQMIGCIHPALNYQRVAMIIYFAELYSYRLIGSNEVFDVLYALIAHQVVLDHNFRNPYDPADNLFRIRLVCTLLKTCGTFFNHGNSKKKLNCFLKYFMRYYWFKKSSFIWTEHRRFPFVISDMIDETMNLVRPAWKLPADFEEACKEVALLEDKIRRTYFSGQYVGEPEEPELEDIQEDEPYDPDNAERQRQGHNRELSDTDNEATEEAEVVVTADNWEKFKPTVAELAEFDAEIERLAIDPGGGRQAKADIPVPIKTSPAKGNKSGGGDGTVSVALLTRKGNKQQIKHIALPEDTDFVKRITASQQAEERERERIKQLTLGISRRQQQEEDELVRHKYENMFKAK